MNNIDRVTQHHREQFGTVDLHRLLSKLTEEVGEVASDITRMLEDRIPAGGKTWDEMAASEIGDVLIVLTVLCDYLGYRIDDVFKMAAIRFCNRTWNATNGGK
jgi:NTP pyrophosphatase (non-canonical NTP hydrolase)